MVNLTVNRPVSLIFYLVKEPHYNKYDRAISMLFIAAGHHIDGSTLNNRLLAPPAA